MTHALETERSELVRRSDLARGFAYMASDHTTRALMKAKAREAYTNGFDEAPAPLAPIGGQEGWFIEPQDMATVLQDIRADGFDLLMEA